MDEVTPKKARRSSKAHAPAVTELVIPLAHPSLTPVMRAGLGGLASTLVALEKEGQGLAGCDVHPDRVHLRWTGSTAESFFGTLFERSFRLADGVIDLPGARPRVIRQELRAALQDALRVTLLQHGMTATKDGAPHSVTVEVDEEPHTFSIQRYADYIHRNPKQASSLARIVGTDEQMDLAGWANPGAVQRHTLAATTYRYRAIEALCGMYAVVGCVSLRFPGGGLLVVPEPADLRRFADARPLLAPRRPQEVLVGGAGDAVLRAEATLHAADISVRRGVARVTAVVFRSMPWASQQKSRGDALVRVRADAAILGQYRELADLLPPRLIRAKEKKGEAGASFAVASSFRAFAADNLARGRRWYQGFAMARDLKDRDRFLHYARRSDNKGALRSEERLGLLRMIEHLDEPERLLVHSVHTAIRQRFGQIADETKDNPHARKNRWNKERDRWRMAFAGAKTREQLRFALADLWSRASGVAELRDGWDPIMSLVQRDWQAARDLALVALASYGAKQGDTEPDSSEEPETELEK